ncbi:phosphoribosyltransferase family protein [Rossellomorea aquimaris]|uniref:phosphoribosyltransferase family protein n=1 Tax=Rossellomorea aquimaris TaxID=189382 RepID=UPI003CEFF24A
MKTTTTSTYCQTQHRLQLLPNMAIDIEVLENTLNLSIDDLFIMAARVNRKRGFLFVSRLLGKHLPLFPMQSLLTSGLLAIEYYEQITGKNVKEKDSIIKGCFSKDPLEIQEAYNRLSDLKLDLKNDPLIIGFAETATSLGHAFFDCIGHAEYIHTTREEIKGRVPVLNFKEEHSHAVNQFCYIDEHRIQNKKPIVLIDDEMTTGKTALNIIRNIHFKFPREHYSVVSILDWRSDENREQFLQLERELGVRIHTTSLMSGHILFSGETIGETEYDYQPNPRENELHVDTFNLSPFFTPAPYVNGKDAIPYIKETGRFGISSDYKEKLDASCSDATDYLKRNRKGKKTLCLGTGELMYLPMKIASLMGEGVLYHSTTRSPILPISMSGYAIQNGFSFLNPEDNAVVHYVYNIPEGEYDELFIFFEKEVSENSLKEIKQLAKDRGIGKMNIVMFSRVERRDDGAQND